MSTDVPDPLAATQKADRGRADRPSKKADKRKRLIEGATLLFNARGIAATGIGDVAESVGLSRATAYYYVRDRAELVWLCYRHACEIAAVDLDRASECGSGLERILAFIDLALTSDRTPVAVLSEVNSLAPDIGVELRDLHEANVARLIAFIEQGIADGSVDTDDPVLVGQAIIGMLSWTQMLPQWSQKSQDPGLRERAACTMTALVSDGISSDTAFGFACPVDAADHLPRLDDVFDRQQAADLKRERVLTAASKLFNRQGIEATSLDEIAAALGLTKGGIYHYLSDKPDLVRQCYKRALRLYEKFVDDAVQHSSTGFEAAMINAHLNIQAQAGDVSPLMPQPGFEALPDALRDELHERARAQNRAVAGLLSKGIAEGSARPCDAGLATHLLAGAFGWIPKWLPRDDALSPRDIADRMCDFILHGIAAAH